MGDTGEIKVEKRYRSLRSIASVLRLFGALLLIVGVALLAAALLGAGPFIPLLMSGLSCAGSALILFALAECIQVIIDIEDNTRRTWLLTQVVLKRTVTAAEAETSKAA